MHCVVLAGGSGTRFWPMSRKAHPKQLLNLTNNKSLLVQTAQRLEKYKDCDGVYIIASPQLTEKIRSQLPDVSDSHYIIEPSGRNTAPAIALAALVLQARHGDTVMGIFPSDHLIRNDKAFHQALDDGRAKALEGPNLVTLGIQPTYPATGYGYVQFKRVAHGDIHPVIRFTEKPDLEKAKTFLERGDHLWNGGMFIWRTQTILESLARNLPMTYEKLSALEPLVDTPDFQPALEKVWPEVDSISIDYGVLELAAHIFTVETRFEWNDLGSWRTLFDILPKDREGNVVQGNATAIGARNTFVKSDDHFTAVIGVEDLVVVSLPDATLVMPRKDSERVKEIVQWLKSRDMGDLT